MIKRVARIVMMNRDHSAKVVVEGGTGRVYDLFSDKVSTCFWRSLVNPKILEGFLVELCLSSDEKEIISAHLLVFKS